MPDSALRDFCAQHMAQLGFTGEEITDSLLALGLIEDVS